MNQVEGWFSILQGQSLTGASFTSVEQLKKHIDAFIESYNEDAEPFVWSKRKSTSAASKDALLATCIPGTSLLVGQAQETAVSKRLASWLAIIAVPTAVAGIYGMNFKYIPETQLEYGYFIVMGLMLLTCAGLYWRFRRVGWL